MTRRGLLYWIWVGRGVVIPERLIEEKRKRSAHTRTVAAGVALLVTALGALTLTGDKLEQSVGSGVVVQVPRPTGEFRGVVCRNAVEVRVRQAETSSVTVEGEENLVPLITTVVKNGRLTIDTKRGSFTATRPLVVHVATPALELLEMSGSGTIRVQDGLAAESLQVDLNGSGDISLQGTFGHVEADLSGSGVLLLRGTARSQGIDLEGSGTIDAQNLLVAEECRVNLNGSGDCLVWTEGKLAVELDGSGDVRYKGEPSALASDLQGSGRLQPLQ